MAPKDKRGSRGDGSHWLGKDGKWHGYIPKQDGTGRRWYFTANTERDIKRRIREALRKREAGQSPGTERVTVEGYLLDWLRIRVEPHLSPVTYVSYEMNVRRHIVPGVGGYPLQKLQGTHIQEWINDRTARKEGVRSIRYSFVVLKAALRQALRDHIILYNPADSVTLPKAPHVEIQYWTPEQSRAFLGAVGGDRYEALYAIGLGLGLRRGELLGLTWGAVDLDRGRLSVATNLQQVHGAFRLLEPKTKASRRTVVLPPFIVRLLRQRRAQYLEERLHAGKRWRGAGWDLVFGTPLGLPYSPQSLSPDFDRHALEAGLPRITVHGMRHSAATLMLSQGLHIKLVAQVLGHSSIVTTLQIYGHVMPSQMEEAAARVDALLG